MLKTLENILKLDVNTILIYDTMLTIIKNKKSLSAIVKPILYNKI